MSDLYYDVQGEELISVKYDGTTSFLKISEIIIALNVAGPYQDIPNSYFIRGNFTSDFVNEYIRRINFDLYSGCNFFKERNNSMEQFLKIFGKGRFYIEKSLNHPVAKIESEYELIVGNFKTQAEPLLFTRDQSNLKKEIIDNYKQEMEEGKRPVIFTYRKDYGGETGDRYIIDGHHKLVAYEESNIQPHVWEIVNIGQKDYDITDQVLCQYLNHSEIKETSLKYFYRFEENEQGNITKLILKF